MRVGKVASRTETAVLLALWFDKRIGEICAPSANTWTSWLLKIVQIRCPEASVKDYHSTLRHTPEERKSHQHRGGSLKRDLSVSNSQAGQTKFITKQISALCRVSRLTTRLLSSGVLSHNRWCIYLPLFFERLTRKQHASLKHFCFVLTSQVWSLSYKYIQYKNVLDQRYSNCFVRVPPHILSLQLCTPKVVGA